MPTAPTLTVGMEEELFLVDLETGDVVDNKTAARVRNALDKKRPKQIVSEFLMPQIELVSRPHSSLADLYAEMAELRTVAIKVANEHDVGVIASSTHPFGVWLDQLPNDHPRYKRLLEYLQATCRRMLVCGMHVHVGIENRDERMRIFNQIFHFLPDLLLLSTSSPFWKGHDTGLSSYRLNVIDGLPRAGLPLIFDDCAAYDGYIKTLVDAGVIDDASEIWWDARLSCKFPTVEMRITDICPKLEDAVAIAGLYTVLVRYLYRNPELYPYNRMLNAFTSENRFRAQRFQPSECEFVETRNHHTQTFTARMASMQEVLAEDAAALGAEDLMARCQAIIDEGTSALRQRQVLEQAKAKGLDHKAALREVVNSLQHETALV